MQSYNYSFFQRVKLHRRVLLLRFFFTKVPFSVCWKVVTLAMVLWFACSGSMDIYASKIPTPKALPVAQVQPDDFDVAYRTSFLTAAIEESEPVVRSGIAEKSKSNFNRRPEKKPAEKKSDNSTGKTIATPEQPAEIIPAPTKEKEAVQPENDYKRIGKAISDATKKDKPEHLKVDHGAPANVFDPKEKPENIYDDEGQGSQRSTAPQDEQVSDDEGRPKLEIKVNEDYQYLAKIEQDAHDALMAGMNEAAIELYKKAVEINPKGKNAMLGLAIAYHRNNQYAQARKLYAQILATDPHNKEALSNYLVLISMQSPAEALQEFEKLYSSNPDFSLLPAQMGMVYFRQGNYQEAAKYLVKAVMLAPDNLIYKYNLAIAFDQLGNREEAARFYQQVIAAGRAGAEIPDSPDKLQERLNFIVSNPSVN